MPPLPPNPYVDHSSDETGALLSSQPTRAEPPAPAHALPPGAALGPYEVVALLGAGGMGEVYRARDPRLAREVAVKVIRSPPPPATATPARRFSPSTPLLASLHGEARFEALLGRLGEERQGYARLYGELQTAAARG